MKKVLKSNLLLSIGITIISILICYFFFDFKIVYVANDDYILSYLIKSGGVSESIFLSYFLTAPLGFLAKVFPSINLFMLYQLILSFFSFVLISYILLEKFTKKYAFVFILMFNILFISIAFVFPHYTQTTALGCSAGYIAVFSAFTFYKKDKYKYILAGCGALLTIISSWMRFYSVLAVSAVFFVFVLSYLFVFYWKNKVKNNISITKTIKKTIKKNLSLIVSLFITVVLVFGINLVSDVLKSNTYGYDSYNAYNKARTDCIDYKIVKYSGNEEFYNSKGIYSQNDINLFKVWLCDDDLFTEETLSSIKEYTDELGTVSPLNAIQNAITLEIDNLANSLNINSYLLLGILVFIFIVGCEVLFIFRNKMKFMFPTLLIGVYIWYFITYTNQLSYILALPVLGLIIATGYFFNRYHYFYLLTVSAVILPIIIYMRYSRIYYRSSYTVFIIAILCLTICIDKDNIRASIARQNKKTVKIALLCFSTISLMVTSVYAGHISVTKQFSYDYFNEDLYNYVENNDDELFVCLYPGYGCITKNYSSPLESPQIPENVLLQSGWLCGSQLNENKKEEYNLEKVFAGMINNQSVNCIAGISAKGYLEYYFNQHFADQNHHVYLLEQQIFGEYCVYKIILA